jgi:hypothetical protein
VNYICFLIVSVWTRKDFEKALGERWDRKETRRGEIRDQYKLGRGLIGGCKKTQRESWYGIEAWKTECICKGE